MNVRIRVVVKGIVQGVSFRYYTVEEAVRHGVRGWVKNLPNGDVQGCFEGEEKDVKTLLDWCRQGPPLASVDEVIVERENFTGEFSDFRMLR
jgi:acylphosphatase